MDCCTKKEDTDSVLQSNEHNTQYTLNSNILITIYDRMIIISQQYINHIYLS